MMTRSGISANRWWPSKRSWALVPLLLAIAGLASCVQPLKVTGAWNEGATRPQTFKKLLIVGVSPDYKQRCNFEAALATTLRSDTVKAIGSCSAMTADEQLSRESIERVVASQGADGVLASRLVAATTGAKEGGSRDTRGSGMYKATDMGYGYYGMPVVLQGFCGIAVHLLAGERIRDRDTTLRDPRRLAGLQPQDDWEDPGCDPRRSR